MEFLPGTIGIVNNPSEQMISEKLQELLKDFNGILGYRNPPVGARNKSEVPSFIIIIEGSGIILLDVVENKIIINPDSQEIWLTDKEDSIYSRDIILDRFKKEIENRLKDDINLYDRKNDRLIIEIKKLLIFSNNFPDEINNLIKAYDILNDVIGEKEIESVINEFIKQNKTSINNTNRIISLTEGTKAFEKKRSLGEKRRLETLGDFIEKSLDFTFRLDSDQRRIAMQVPQGPQRIRGLAGTGKTVILALKAAQTHIEFEDFKILFTFNTQSMYNQIRSLISQYMAYESRTEPDWKNLFIYHAWGGKQNPGVYSTTCEKFGLKPFTFLDVKRVANPNEYIFNDILKRIKNQKIEPIYDIVLIDEAQDFPQPFFELLYLLTKPPKRIIWAYDEFQSLNELRIKEPEELFGTNKDGRPNIPNSDLYGQYLGGIDKDFILSNCYRNPRISLMFAHGLGLGIYRKKGLVDIVFNRQSWQALGYKVHSPKKESFSEGDEMVIERPEKFSKNILEKIIKELGKEDKELIICKTFNRAEYQYLFIVNEIHKLISKEGIKEEQILIISLASVKTKEIFAFIRQQLDKRNIKSITPGYIESSDKFQETGYITLTTPFRAKGNEADVVFVADCQYVVSSFSFRARNAIFVSITRSRGLCYLSGFGSQMIEFNNELNMLSKFYPRFEFIFPNEDDIHRRRIILQKDSSEIEKAENELIKIMEKNPELLVETLKNNPEFLKKIQNDK